MLAGMALKRRWASRTGNDPARKPNLVMGANVQVCWEKFCRYWDVEPRIVPMTGNLFHLDAGRAVAQCDANTIGVVGILGSTYDGSYEPIAEIAAALDELARVGGPDVPIHVDGASGAMIAPFLDPELVWDFRLPRVASINTSGHKFGLVYPGVGWVLWRDAGALPPELIFDVNYLGGNMPTFALNFSRPGAEMVAQYYTFFRLGRAGFRAVQQSSRDIALFMSGRIGAMPEFELISRGDELPVFAFTTSAGVTGWDVFALSRALRERGWLVPAYSFPADRADLAVLRVVCRNGFSHDLAEMFLDHLRAAIDRLGTDRSIGTASGPSAFHH
jgi:glutamate decarboxylase